MCPGIVAANIPVDAVKAIKCFDQLEHPSMGSTATATAAPPVQTSATSVPTTNATSLTNPVPDPARCAAGLGQPGAVYLCEHNAGSESTVSCGWSDSAMATKCMNVKDLGTASFIGPDFGGSCSFYPTLSCDAGSEIAIAGEK